MTVRHILFSFKGRIGRATFWGANLSVFALGVGVSLLAYPSFKANPQLFLEKWDWIVTLMTWLTWWPILALGVKRFHDRNQTGWLVLALFFPIPIGSLAIVMNSLTIGILSGFVSIVIAIYFFINLGCLKGTFGDNTYGPDPLAGNEEHG